MKNKKVKVKLVVGYKQYRVIEVEESEVEKIREVNRMTWRELKQEIRKKESMAKANIVVDSIEDIEEEFESIPDPNAVNPIDEMIEAEEKQEKYAPLYQAIAQLTERQQEMVRIAMKTELWYPILCVTLRRAVFIPIANVPLAATACITSERQRGSMSVRSVRTVKWSFIRSRISLR